MKPGLVKAISRLVTRPSFMETVLQKLEDRLSKLLTLQHRRVRGDAESKPGGEPIAKESCTPPQAGTVLSGVQPLAATVLPSNVVQTCYGAADMDRRKVVKGWILVQHRQAHKQAGRQTHLQVCRPKGQLLLGPIGFKGDETTGGSCRVASGRNHAVHYLPCQLLL